jgi:hypothetical protein
VFVISDFLDGSEYVPLLKQLAFRRFDVNLIQVLTPEEVDPALGGDLLLVDGETGETREVTLNAATKAAYGRALAALRGTLEALMGSSGVLFAHTTTAVPFEELMLRQLRKRRLLGG